MEKYKTGYVDQRKREREAERGRDIYIYIEMKCYVDCGGTSLIYKVNSRTARTVRQGNSVGKKPKPKPKGKLNVQNIRTSYKVVEIKLSEKLQVSSLFVCLGVGFIYLFIFVVC